jgi:hypothetical protein
MSNAGVHLHKKLSDFVDAQQEKSKNGGALGLSKFGDEVNESRESREENLLLQGKCFKQSSERVVDAVDERGEERVGLDMQYAAEGLFELDQAEVAKEEDLAFDVVTLGLGHGSSGRHDVYVYVYIGRFLPWYDRKEMNGMNEV